MKERTVWTVLSETTRGDECEGGDDVGGDGDATGACWT